MDNASIKMQLEQYAEPNYQKFNSKLLPGVENILGVRLPPLRSMAKQIAKEDWRTYLLEASDATFEEVMLQGMVIGYAKAEMEEILKWVSFFLPKIDNWSVCDSFCSSLKITQTDPREVLEYLTPLLREKRPYHVRFAVVMLLNYYVKEEYTNQVFTLLDAVMNEHYYVKMSVAWAVSIFFIKLPEQTMPYLKKNSLDDFTYNKAIQKILESRAVDCETKQKIRQMKRSTTATAAENAHKDSYTRAKK